MAALALPESVTVVEMLPRDGFQNYGEFVPTEEKVAVVDALSTTGVDEIEITSFTHPDAVPALRDAEDVVAGIERRDGVTYRALVPNVVGMERALAAGVDKVNALVVASETYSRKNQNMTPDESVAAIERIVEMADGTGVDVEAGVGTSFFCPYEGRVPPERTLSIVEAVLDAGVDEVTLATTTGMANPRQVDAVLTELFDRWPAADCGLHLHDTNGLSLANTLVAMQCGVDRFDASVCGLGGGVVLPAALRGVGNTPTEDLVNALHEMAVETDIDFARLEAVARNVADRLDLGAPSHVLKGGTAENVLATTGEAT